MPEIEKIDLPEGYTLEWGGEYEESNEGKEPLAVMFPFCLLGMFVLLIMQFNAIRQPVIIFLCVPLSIIGVTAGLLVTNLAFGFMAILGFLGLSGMLIKNAIILIDQIEIDRKTQENPYHAILSAAVSRLRPVVLASGTTVLGMTPLIWDPFYASMAATIAGGLIIGTALTLIVEPLFYMLFFRITPTGLPKKEKGTDRDDGEGEKKQVEDASSGASLEEEDAVDNEQQEKKEEKNDDQSSSEESS
jgi:multidrug efflux pump subunit AcrB